MSSWSTKARSLQFLGQPKYAGTVLLIRSRQFNNPNFRCGWHYFYILVYWVNSESACKKTCTLADVGKSFGGIYRSFFSISVSAAKHCKTLDKVFESNQLNPRRPWYRDLKRKRTEQHRRNCWRLQLGWPTERGRHPFMQLMETLNEMEHEVDEEASFTEIFWMKVILFRQLCAKMLETFLIRTDFMNCWYIPLKKLHW